MVETKELTSVDELAELCGHDANGLRETMEVQRRIYRSEGWFVHEAQVLDSSKYGNRTVCGYGGAHTFQTMPQTLFALDGSASGTGVVIAYLPAAAMGAG